MSPPELRRNELAPLLWVIVVLVVCFEVTWWIFDRMYS
jgi:hypothetical protein